MAKNQTRAQTLSPEDELAEIRETLKHPVREDDTRYWLDTGEPRLNEALGSKDRGLPYGKQYEWAGWESHGKTSQSYGVLAAGQRDGAKCAIWDLEDSSDEDWMEKRGLDYSKIVIFRPIVGRFGKEPKKRPMTAEEQAEEIELWMDRSHERNPEGRIILLVDSIAAMVPKEEEEKSISQQNMRTKVSTATFMSFLMRRWQKRISSYNAQIHWINQIRVAPGKWGNPEYTTGGNAIRFYCSVRVKVRKTSGKILKAGKPIGFKGLIINYKNKAGEASREGFVTGFKQYYDGRVVYVPEEDVRAKKE